MLMAAMKSIIGNQEKEDESRIYLYVIQPEQDVDEVNEDQSLWRGKVHHIQDQIKVKFQNMTNHIKDQMAEQKKSFTEQLSVVQKTIQEMKEALLQKMENGGGQDMPREVADG